MDELLGYVLKARFVTICGGSAGFIPDVLFEHGVHMVHSSRISDPDAFERGMINDLKKEELPVGPPPDMKVARRDVVKQMESNGFKLAAEHTFLPYQYFLVFVMR